MNDLIKSTIFEDNALQHHGVLGMKWGVRRYQPYGQGGYDPKNKGKFVGGEKQQKRLVKELNKIGKKEHKKGKYLYEARKKLIKDKGLVEAVKNNKKLREANYEYDKYISELYSTDHSPKKRQSLKDKRNNASEKLASELLGQYSDTLVKDVMNTYDKGTAKKSLSDILNVIASESNDEYAKIRLYQEARKNYFEDLETGRKRKDTELEDMIRMDRQEKKRKK